MNDELNYIIALGKKYKEYDENHDKMFEDLNSVSEDVLNDIIEDYTGSGINFRPVKLLRAEIARLLLFGESIDAQKIEEIKNNHCCPV